MVVNFFVPVGIWGGKGQGKTFQTELIFRAMGVEPVIMSAGELESERAGGHSYWNLFPETCDNNSDSYFVLFFRFPNHWIS